MVIGQPNNSKLNHNGNAQGLLLKPTLDLDDGGDPPRPPNFLSIPNVNINYKQGKKDGKKEGGKKRGNEQTTIKPPGS